MEKLNYVDGLFSYIQNSPSPYHAVDTAKKMLNEAGFTEVMETETWNLKAGGNYYVTRSDSAIIAFQIPEKEAKGFHMVASHDDSPCFKLKENPELTVGEMYTRLNVEKYGGMIVSTWLDRPLSIAGRVYVDTPDGMKQCLIHFDEDLLVIPNMAIHMNREINDGYKYGVQSDMCPLMGLGADKEMLRKRIAEQAGAAVEDILGQDLYLYTRQPGITIGNEKELLLCPRLDDLECAYSSLQAMCESKPEQYVNVCVVLNNEEVGSSTRQGADSDFLGNTLKRIIYACGGNDETYMRAIADSFLVSADNAHAVHPSHPEKSDPSNRPVINGGIVIKYSGNQRYTSDAFSGSVMKKICKNAGVPYQVFYNHSDMIGGSTLGNIATHHVSVASVDIGLPQFAMHSSVETAGTKDVGYLVEALKEFYRG